MSESFRIGVDVGGTNTDGVILDPLANSTSNRGILAWTKRPTTPNPSEGIENVITTLLRDAKVDVSSVASVTIGTTHFINAVVEKDQNRLKPVAVIRLCGPFSRDVPPGIDWPPDLRDIICAYCGFVDGGLELDGQLIRSINEVQIAEECKKIKQKGIRSIVINGIFSPLDVIEKQEEVVGEWVKKYYPEADVVLSKEVANLGYVERENAAILNASILSFARKTILSFQKAIHRLNLACPVFITQNDGTILTAPLAAMLPIRTFSSGPTNSMCGAAFLVQGRHHKESMLVVDIGGTTTDCGMLLPSGLPRQAASVTEVSGVRLNFSCPDVKSQPPSSPLTIGPDSVGHRIQQEALVFDGKVHTATDYAVTSQNLTSIGDAALSLSILNEDLVKEYEVVVKSMLERVIDTMKTNAEDIPVLLVGGGAVLAPDKLDGASTVEKPEYAGVANAIGAAIARVSGIVDTMVSTAEKSNHAAMQEVSKAAIEKAVGSGALRETVSIAEMDDIPLPYIANKSRIIVKAIGDFDFSVTSKSTSLSPLDGDDADEDAIADKKPLQGGSIIQAMTAAEIIAYRPTVNSSREWIISEIDLEWIMIGCYILGTGGGGTPYPQFIKCRELLRKGAMMKVISPDDLLDDAVVATGGGKGSPAVGIEKLSGDEMMQSQRVLYAQVGYQPTATIALEIGGGNGLQGLFLGASCNMNLPTVDGDWMGRAYPVGWQITPVVWGGDKPQFIPQVICDGNGNTMGTTEKLVERAFRAALSEMGSHVACARGPITGAKTKAYAVQHTISLSWRIGRAVALCRAKNEIDYVSEAIISEAGGPESAKILFKGKIVQIERRTVIGHLFGEITIKAADVSGSRNMGEEFSGSMKIPFKNENLVAKTVTEDGTEEIVASVPDLICVCDAANGGAIGTPEYKYGLLVVVIGIQASDKWTAIPRGIEIGGPRAFGIDIDYKPLGKFNLPVSVIDEYVKH
ncbi:uncharacterized protein EV420DRAFT_1616471 [Desarmillaria tabescens]|uniref:Hydantoinase n=1 Tax=Armillaria tabescens TaxID=1929756 RepID=A0AA39NQT8_ARMTA|nr:uncharacterized protein EV420DRAFT_1616471 [Desarmillaria tabescens]KAK0470131.1 hypothetical protein EV420DRAFT_1616471 [Desarmillaria tabescens]